MHAECRCGVLLELQQGMGGYTTVAVAVVYIDTDTGAAVGGGEVEDVDVADCGIAVGDHHAEFACGKWIGLVVLYVLPHLIS